MISCRAGLFFTFLLSCMGALLSHLKTRSAVCLLPLLLLSSHQTQAGLSASDFDEANKLYEAGKYVEAAAAYGKLLQSGEASQALYFNLGNAFFKSGQIGRAILAYRNAERISPRDPDVRANLQFARNQVQGPTVSPKLWQRWLGKLSLNEWTFLTSAAIWLWLLLLTLIQWRAAWRPLLRTYIILAGLIAGLLCVCFAVAFSELHTAKQIVVVVPDAAVHQGPLDESPSVFTAHDGAELRVLDRKDDWLQVATDSRRTGWVRRDQVAVASPITRN